MAFRVFNLDPDSREVTSALFGYSCLSPSGEQFYSLGFLSDGGVGESMRVLKSGGFVN